MERDLKLETALKAARLRGKLIKDSLINSDEFISANQVMELLYIGRRDLQVLCCNGDILSLGFNKFPIWQFNNKGEVYPEIKILMDILEYSWPVYRFLKNSHTAMNGKTGIELLKMRKTKLLLELAKGYYTDFT